MPVLPSSRPRSPARRRTGAVIASAAAGLVLTSVFRLTRGLPAAIGAPRKHTRPAAGRTEHWDGRAFRNTLPASILEGPSMLRVATAMATRGDVGKPSRPIAVASPEIPDTAADLAATWLGHATVLLEVDGYRILTDPVFGDRVSPSPQVGPARMHPAPMAAAELPLLDAVLISHDHYDHLEVGTIRELVRSQRCPFLVPLGVGAHLRSWGVPADRIIELDWDEAAPVGGLTITCTEARHFSGRLFARDTTLWSSWAIAGPTRRVFFGGDTGYTPAFAGIGARYGPFDLTVLPIGAYNQNWSDIHLNPEEAVRAHGDLGGRLLLPIHWATFDLAFHSWSDPVERLTAAAGECGVAVALPRPGQRFVVGVQVPDAHWWE